MRPTLQPPTIQGRWTLPPLILHPFASEDSADRLLEGSKAALMLHGLLPDRGADRESLAESVVRSRLMEVRMLYFLGRDILRWVEQCVDFTDSRSELKNAGIRAQSFTAWLVEATPDSIGVKLESWGVTDQRSVFSRSVGVTSALHEPPTSDTLSSLFLNHYHRFLDYLYVCYQNLAPFTEISSQNFEVQMYASAEYSSMLAEQWSQETEDNR